MRTIPYLMTVAAFTIGVAIVFSASSSGAVIPVNDWYANSNGHASAIINNGNTNSPNYMVYNQNLTSMFSYFNPVTLSDGETLSFSFGLTLDLAGEETSKTFALMRFGLFTASTPHTTTADFGADRVSSLSTNNLPSTRGWQGFMLNNASSPAGVLTLYSKPSSSDSHFTSTSGINGSTSLTTTGGYTMAFTDGVTRTYTLVFERDGNNLIVSGSYGTGTFSGTYTNAFASAGYNVFDGFGLSFTASDGVTIDSAQFSDVNLTHIPEPSSLTLLTLGLLPLLRRKKCGENA